MYMLIIKMELITKTVENSQPLILILTQQEHLI